MDKKSQNSDSLRYKIYWIIINFARSNNVFRIIIDVAAYIFYRSFRSNKTFSFQGERYHYFYHPYNRTVASERIVEIPLAKRVIDYYEYRGKKILEVGNVLSHYFPIRHDVLDKYEKESGVINQDVVGFRPLQKYDLIISISTMEHVGWTYGEKKDPGKFLRGVENFKKHLVKNGLLMVTFPLFYRDDLSKLIADRKMPFTKEYFMKRTSFLNEWVEVDFDKATKGNTYDKYFANANVLYIGFYGSSSIPKSTRLRLVRSDKVGGIKSVYRFVKSFFEDL